MFGSYVDVNYPAMKQAWVCLHDSRRAVGEEETAENLNNWPIMFF